MDDICNSNRRFRFDMLHVWYGEVVTLSEIVKPSEFNFCVAGFHTAGKT